MKKYVIVFLIWVMIIPIAILNGGFREYVLMVHLEILALPLSKTRLHFIWRDVVCFDELI